MSLPDRMEILKPPLWDPLQSSLKYGADSFLDPLEEWEEPPFDPSPPDRPEPPTAPKTEITWDPEADPRCDALLLGYHPTAKWHRDPPTRNQLQVLKRRGLPSRGWTKGSASYIIGNVLPRLVKKPKPRTPPPQQQKNLPVRVDRKPPTPEALLANYKPQLDWQNQPPTKKQLAILARRGLPVNGGAVHDLSERGF